MATKYIKLALSVLIGLFMVYQFYLINIGYGILLLLLLGIIVLTLFFNEHMIIAQFHLRKQDMNKAQAALDRIKNYEHLPKSQHGYYHLLFAMVAPQAKKLGLGKTETYLRKALSLGLKQDQAKAMAKLNLAYIAASKRKKREAINLLADVKKLDKGGVLEEQSKQLKKQLGRI